MALPSAGPALLNEPQLPGFVADVNRLIDAFAELAEATQALRLADFKALFRAGSYAYLHQAYPGLEHCGDYVQLLYAAALDRLDHLSPTLPPHSPLWARHVADAEAGPQQSAAAAPLPQAGLGERQQQQQPAEPSQAAGEPLLLQHEPQDAGAIGAAGLGQRAPLVMQQLPPWDPLACEPLPLLPAGCFAPTQPAAGQRQALGWPGSPQPAAQADPAPGAADEGPDFFFDVMAMFGESAAEEPHAQGLGTLPGLALEPAPQQELAMPAAPQLPVERQLPQQAAPLPLSQPQPQPVQLRVPLSVKAGVLFALHCLHGTQLCLPRAAIYVPLPLLQQLTATAHELRAAGPPARDALSVLQQLLAQRRLLVGLVRRPNEWEPQLPAWLMQGRTLGPMGRALAISRAEQQALRRARGSSLRMAAITAAANSARAILARRGLDEQVHRDALFHVKTALQGLSNLGSLQALCSEYAAARAAVFKPLLQQPGSSEPAQPPPQQQQEHQQQPQRAQDAQQAPDGGRASGSEDEEAAAFLLRSRGKSRMLPRARARARQDKPAGAPSAALVRAGGEQQLVGAASASAQAGAMLELFDGGFGAAVQQLARDEAARMLLLLDPYFNKKQVAKRRQEQERAERAAQAACAQAAAAQLLQFSAAREAKRRRLAQLGLQVAALEAPAANEELACAGILHPAELADMEAQAAGLEDVDGAGKAAGRAVAASLARRRHTLSVASEWLRAHDAMMHDEDMP